MDNMKLLQYAANAAIDEMIRYQRFAIKFAGQKSGVIAEKKSKEIADDLNEIKTMIQDEKRKQMAKAEEEVKQRLNADVIAEVKNLIKEQIKPQQPHKVQQTAEAQRMKQAIKEASYVLVIKWNDPIMGEMEYPFKSYAEAEKNFEVAKREVHNRHATEAHVYEQGEGQRVPVMGIMSGKL